MLRFSTALGFFGLLLLGSTACANPSDRDQPESGTGDSTVDTQKPVVTPPVFESTVSPLPEDLRGAMSGTTWTHECPVHLNDLRLIEANYWDYNGALQTGRLVVAVSATDTFVAVLKTAFDSQFPFERMEPVSGYNGSDDASMAANNTSAFNCRAVTGGSSWSQHSYGNAIDINPIQNPYVKGNTVLPPAGAAYLQRDPSVPGLLVQDSPVVQEFLAAGWGWGGNWSSLKDYQHFSETGK
jgi:hypothetical protein